MWRVDSFRGRKVNKRGSSKRMLHTFKTRRRFRVLKPNKFFQGSREIRKEILSHAEWFNKETNYCIKIEEVDQFFTTLTNPFFFEIDSPAIKDDSEEFESYSNTVDFAGDLVYKPILSEDISGEEYNAFHYYRKYHF